MTNLWTIVLLFFVAVLILMNYALLHCLSDADNRFEAVVEVRDCLAEHLVNIEVSDETVPVDICKSEIPGELTFYSARPSSGGVFDSRPYRDLDTFLDEFRSVLGHDLYRIARFEQKQKNYSYSEEEYVSIDGDKKKMLSLAEDLMKSINSMNIDDDERLLGKIFHKLSVKRVPEKNLVSGVSGYTYSMVLDGDELGFSEHLIDDGVWIVSKVESFNGTVHDLYPEIYYLDCTSGYPYASSLEELTEHDRGYIVEVETKY